MLSGELAKKKNLSLTEAGILAGATFGVKALCRATVAKSKKAGGLVRPVPAGRKHNIPPELRQSLLTDVRAMRALNLVRNIIFHSVPTCVVCSSSQP
jgi:hypothetical protein